MTLKIAAVDRKDQSVHDSTNKACICESEGNNVKQECVNAGTDRAKQNMSRSAPRSAQSFTLNVIDQQ